MDVMELWIINFIHRETRVYDTLLILTLLFSKMGESSCITDHTGLQRQRKSKWPCPGNGESLLFGCPGPFLANVHSKTLSSDPYIVTVSFLSFFPQLFSWYRLFCLTNFIHIPNSNTSTKEFLNNETIHLD